jgi:hypothetical protein
LVEKQVRPSSPPSSSRRCWRASCRQTEHLHARAEKSERLINQIAHRSSRQRGHRDIVRTFAPLLCQGAREAQEPPKCRIIVLRRPDATERDGVRTTTDRTKLHLRKAIGDRGFARETHYRGHALAGESRISARSTVATLRNLAQQGCP